MAGQRDNGVVREGKTRSSRLELIYYWTHRFHLFETDLRVGF